jgi:hypothetical protein
MKEFIAVIPPEQLVALIGAVGILIAAVIGFIGRKLIKIFERYTDTRTAESATRQVDVIAGWAAGATTQALKNALIPKDASAEDKMQYAVKEARAQLPSEVSEQTSDDTLKVAIESKVALSKMPPPMPGSPSIPPSAN